MKRGRKSSADLDIITKDIEIVQRPDAPYELDDEAAAEWQGVVDRMPADWFGRETYPLLVQYCRHICAARKVAMLIKQAADCEQVDVGLMKDLLKMQEAESRAIASLATRMRLSQQATLTKRADKGTRGVTKPWQNYAALNETFSGSKNIAVCLVGVWLGKLSYCGIGKKTKFAKFTTIPKEQDARYCLLDVKTAKPRFLHFFVYCIYVVQKRL